MILAMQMELSMNKAAQKVTNFSYNINNIEQCPENIKEKIGNHSNFRTSQILKT